MAEMDLVLRMTEISKAFPGVRANEKVNFTLRRGEIHALVGENGAGKTTLMRVLYGMYQPDAGSIELLGKTVTVPSPLKAIAMGIGMVHQHFMLVPSLSIAENIILGAEPLSGGLLDRRRAIEEVRAVSERYGLKVDPRAAIRDCSVGIQQRVEILKALYRGAELLILDEPTAVLTPQETEELFVVLRSLAQMGKSIVFISHKLREVLAISDRITVMRHGRMVDEVVTAGTTERQLASLMVGRDVLLRVDKQPAKPGAEIIRFDDLWAADDRGLPAVRGVSFSVRSGEIVGIAGVEGNGQTELVEALTGLRPVAQGAVLIEGKALPSGDPRGIREMGVAHVPEDRFKRGLCAQASIAENLIAGSHDRAPIANRSVFDQKAIAARAQELVERFDVRTPGIDVAVGTLSGGNAQKVVVAREFTAGGRFLVASQPTRGVDIGAIEFIHQHLVAKRDEGCAILLVSADLQEVMSLSDRIIVLYEGHVMGEAAAADATEEGLGLLMLGGNRREQVEGGATA